jgi:hypothetical protein
MMLATACGGAVEDDSGSSQSALRNMDGELPDIEPPTGGGGVPKAPPPIDKTGTDRVVAQGSGWTEYKVNGAYRDADTGVDKMLAEQSVLVVRGLQGVSSAPLSAVAKNALNAEVVAAATATAAPTDDMVYFVHRETADKLGTPSPSGAVALAGCSDYYKNYTVDKGYSKSGSLDKSFNSSEFVGTFKVAASSSGSAAATLRLKVKRGGILGVCVPYAVGFVNVRLQGQASALADVESTGNFRKEWNYSTTIAKPDLGSFPFLIGPVPVRIGFNLPIEAGVSANGFVATTVKGQAQANGSFDYTCTSGGCSGTKSFTAGFTPSGTPTGFVSGRILVKPWVQAGLRVYLYTDSIAYGQVGIRPGIDLDLFGYAGNACGDGNGDGTSEWVAGTSLDSAFRLDLTAKAYLLGGDWETSFNITRRQIGFWMSGGANAPWTPMLRVSKTDVTTATVVAGSRPCWPYADALNYQLAWGDGATEAATRAPGTHSFVHTYPGRGTYPMTVKLVNDAQGRNIDSSVANNVFVSGFPTFTVQRAALLASP